jgi:hypothetical protein
LWIRFILISFIWRRRWKMEKNKGESWKLPTKTYKMCKNNTEEEKRLFTYKIKSYNAFVFPFRVPRILIVTIFPAVMLNIVIQTTTTTLGQTRRTRWFGTRFGKFILVRVHRPKPNAPQGSPL